MDLASGSIGARPLPVCNTSSGRNGVNIDSLNFPDKASTGLMIMLKVASGHTSADIYSFVGQELRLQQNTFASAFCPFAPASLILLCR
jgi:hypothetical protein